MDGAAAIPRSIHNGIDARDLASDADGGAPSPESRLRALSTAYSRRDPGTLPAHPGPDMDRPDGEDRLHGREQVRGYRLERWSRIRTHDTIMGITRLADDRWPVGIDQAARGLDGSVLPTGRLEHRHRIDDGPVRRMDIDPL